MPWVRFTERFDFKVTPRVTISYRAGCTYLVKQACAEQAVRDGKADYVDRPVKTKVVRHAGR